MFLSEQSGYSDTGRNCQLAKVVNQSLLFDLIFGQVGCSEVDHFS